jgi:hypothetical protein
MEELEDSNTLTMYGCRLCHNWFSDPFIFGAHPEDTLIKIYNAMTRHLRKKHPKQIILEGGNRKKRRKSKKTLRKSTKSRRKRHQLRK